MSRFSKVARPAAVLALVAGLMTFADRQSVADTIIPFDYSGNTQTFVNVTGSGGFMGFTLDLGAPPSGTVAGDFSMEFQQPNNSNAIIGSVDLSSLFGYVDGTNPYGDAVAPPGIFDLFLYNVSQWFLSVNANDMPLRLVIKSTLTPDFVGFAPKLSVSVDGDFQFEVAANAVPLPGALPLFVTGIGVLGAVTWRRRRRQAA